MATDGVDTNGAEASSPVSSKRRSFEEAKKIDGEIVAGEEQQKKRDSTSSYIGVLQGQLMSSIDTEDAANEQLATVYATWLTHGGGSSGRRSSGSAPGRN